MASAHDWLSSTYGAVLPIGSLAETTEQLGDQVASLQLIVAGLRTTTDSVAGWPIGTAQVVDVLRVLLLQTASGVSAAEALDWGIADRLVPQMGQLDDLQLESAERLFAELAHARAALQHLINPHGV